MKRQGQGGPGKRSLCHMNLRNSFLSNCDYPAPRRHLSQCLDAAELESLWIVHLAGLLGYTRTAIHCVGFISQDAGKG